MALKLLALGLHVSFKELRNVSEKKPASDFPLAKKTRVLKKTLSVIVALFFTFNTLDHLTDQI